jgi:ADP-ribosylglycohydrolase
MREINKAVSLGGDSDTLACITGAIAQAYYGHISQEIETQARQRLPDELLAVVDEFDRRYGL